MSSEILVSTLRRLGLNEYEAKVYLALANVGQATAPKLNAMSGVPLGKIYQVLEGLEEKGFVIAQPTRPITYSATPIQDIVETRRRMVFQELSEVEDTLVPALSRPEAAPKRPEELAYIIKGTNNLIAHTGRLLREAKSSINSFVLCEECLVRMMDSQELIRNLRAKGVEWRTIISATEANLKLVKQYVKTLRGFVKIRHFSIVPPTIGSYCVDGRACLIVTTRGLRLGYDTGVLIKDSPIVTALEAVFDHFWEEAQPVEERIMELEGKKQHK